MLLGSSLLATGVSIERSHTGFSWFGLFVSDSCNSCVRQEVLSTMRDKQCFHIPTSAMVSSCFASPPSSACCCRFQQSFMAGELSLLSVSMLSCHLKILLRMHALNFRMPACLLARLLSATFYLDLSHLPPLPSPLSSLI